MNKVDLIDLVSQVLNAVLRGMTKMEMETEDWSVKAYQCGTIIRIDIKKEEH